jgi:hypothetical protein
METSGWMSTPLARDLIHISFSSARVRIIQARNIRMGVNRA